MKPAPERLVQIVFIYLSILKQLVNGLIKPLSFSIFEKEPPTI